jgi:hypothetical protein
MLVGGSQAATGGPSMSSAVALAPQEKTANFFQLCNLSGKTKITYYPFAPGPIIQGYAAGASLKYEGPEGNWTFDDSEITHEDTSLGHLISVVLRPQEGPGPITFWLFLPPVILVEKDFQNFTTYGVRNGSSVQRPSKQISYEVERFFGEAKAVMLAL